MGAGGDGGVLCSGQRSLGEGLGDLASHDLGKELDPVPGPVSCPWPGPVTFLLQMDILRLSGDCLLTLLPLKPETPSLFRGWSLDLLGY